MKNIIITGCTSGLGLAIAKKLANSANLFLVSRDLKKLNELKDSLENNKNHSIYSVDLSNTKLSKKIIYEANKQFDEKIDVLINNAGMYGPVGPLDSCPDEIWEKNIKLNLITPALLIKYTLPIMKKNNFGRIINISGGGAVKPMSTLTAYCASKSGLVRLTETIAHEIKDYENITINAIAPGFLATKFHDEVINSQTANKELHKITIEKIQNGGDDPNRTVNLIENLIDINSKINGKLISSIFDNLEKLNKKKLTTETNFFTLRRIDDFFVYEKE